MVICFSISSPAQQEELAPPQSSTVEQESAAPSLSNQPETVAKESKAESEIPVKLETPIRAEQKSSVLFKALMSFVLVAGVVISAYFLIGKYRRAKIGTSTTPQIKMLTQHYLGPKKSLAIVRVAGESILIGITDQNINHIKTLSLLDEEIPEVTPQSFKQVLKNDEGEDFAIAGIKDFVSSRLKNMRRFE